MISKEIYLNKRWPWVQAAVIGLLLLLIAVPINIASGEPVTFVGRPTPPLPGLQSPGLVGNVGDPLTTKKSDADTTVLAASAQLTFDPVSGGQVTGNFHLLYRENGTRKVSCPQGWVDATGRETEYTGSFTGTYSPTSRGLGGKMETVWRTLNGPCPREVWRPGGGPIPWVGVFDNETTISIYWASMYNKNFPDVGLVARVWGSGSGETVRIPERPPIRDVVVTCKPPPPITEAQIDQYLDFLAALLQFAVEKADSPMLDPLTATDLTNFGADTFTLKAAADLGRSVWDQAHGLQKAHIRGELILSESQKRRTKAFGHWAHFLKWRAEVPFDSPGGPALPPRYRLFGPILEEVPPPPQLKGEDPGDIFIEEYSYAAALTLFQGADLWYTRGLVWPIYLALRDASWKPVILATFSQVRYFGPALIASTAAFHEFNEFSQLTWDEHMQNAVAIYTSALVLRLQTTQQPKPTVDPSQLISEGGGNKAITKKLSESAKQLGVPYQQGRAFFLKRRWTQDGKEFAELVVGSVGPHKGRTPGETGPETRPVTVEVVKQGADEAYFLPDGSRLVPLGEKGYHAWKHVFEKLFGYDTGFTPLLEALQGSQYGPKLQGMARKMNDRNHLDLEPVNQEYKAFVNELTKDPNYQKFSKYDERFAGEVNYIIKVPSKCTGQTHYARVSIEPQSGQLKNLYLMDSYTNWLPKPLANTVFDWLAIPHGSPLYTAPLQNYIPEHVLREKERR